MISSNNSRKNKFLDSIPPISFKSNHSDISKRCKFNFSYMDFSQPESKKFENLNEDRLIELLNKLFDYSKSSLLYWNNEKVGSGKKRRNVFEIYDNFPTNSDYNWPKHVPNDVQWARFRLNSTVRLIGFVLPRKYHKIKHESTNEMFDCNTFYVVFYDPDHKFYKTKL